MWHHFKANQVQYGRTQFESLKVSFRFIVNQVKIASSYQSMVKNIKGREERAQMGQPEENFIDYTEKLDRNKEFEIGNLGKKDRIVSKIDSGYTGLSCFKAKQAENDEYFHCLGYEKDELILSEIPLSESIIVNESQIHPRDVIGPSLKDFLRLLVDKVEKNCKGLKKKYAIVSHKAIKRGTCLEGLVDSKRLNIKMAIDKINLA